MTNLDAIAATVADIKLASAQLILITERNLLRKAVELAQLQLRVIKMRLEFTDAEGAAMAGHTLELIEDALSMEESNV